MKQAEIAAFEEKFGVPMQSAYGGLVEVLKEQELIQTTEGRISLTERGLRLADTVIENFAQHKETPGPFIKKKTPENLSLKIGEAAAAV